MQDRILNPVGLEESLLVIRLRNQSYDAELILREKMKQPLSPGIGRADWTMYEMVCLNPVHLHPLGWVMTIGGSHEEVVCPECGEARHSKFGRSVSPVEGSEE